LVETVHVIFGLLYCFGVGIILGFALGISDRKKYDKELDDYFGEKRGK